MCVAQPIVRFECERKLSTGHRADTRQTGLHPRAQDGIESGKHTLSRQDVDGIILLQTLRYKRLTNKIISLKRGERRDGHDGDCLMEKQKLIEKRQ